MNTAACRHEGPEFGTPGHVEWVRGVLNENVANLQEGFPGGDFTHFVGPKLDVYKLLTRGGIIAPDYPGVEWKPKASSPNAPVYFQVVRPSDMWEDPIEVLAFETVFSQATAIGCEFRGQIEFLLATDSGGTRLHDALSSTMTTPPRIVGRGSTRMETAYRPPEPKPRQPNAPRPRLAESGYTDWFIAELAQNGVTTVDEPLEDWPKDPELAAIPGFSAVAFIKKAKAAGAPVLICWPGDYEADSEDAEPGPPMLLAGFYHEGSVTYAAAFDEGGLAARAGVVGIDVDAKAELERQEDYLLDMMRSSASSTFEAPAFKPHPDRATDRKWANMPAVVPTPANLLEQSDRYRAEIDEWAKQKHDPDDRYIDFSTDTPVPQRHRPLVDLIVRDPAYSCNLDPDERDRIVRRHAGHLADDEYDVVAGGSYYTFKYTIGCAIRHFSLPWARDLAAHPEVRAEWKDAELKRWIDAQLPPGTDPRLAQEIRWELQRQLRRRASAARLLADDLYSRIEPSLLDRVGFTSRREDRHTLLAGSLAELPVDIRRVAGDHVISKERNERSKKREQRYATAGRALLTYGLTPSATANKLGISPAVLKRLIASHPKDVRLTREDPLIALLPR